MKRGIKYNEETKTYNYKVYCNRCRKRIGYGFGQKANKSSFDLCYECEDYIHKKKLEEGK